MLDLLIITGASRGIGASIYSKCFDLNIAKTIITVSSSGDKTSIKLDLTDYKNVSKIIQKNILSLGKINSIGIVLCASQVGEYGGLLDADLNDWDKLYKCNVLGNLAVIQGCSSIIKSDAKSRIAFFAGGGAAFAWTEFSGYALSKVATVRAVENLAVELKDYDSSVIAIAPGAVATDMLSKIESKGVSVRTKTDISEPTNFVYRFLNDEFPSKKINGKFLHVRDDINKIEQHADMFQLRRIDK